MSSPSVKNTGKKKSREVSHRYVLTVVLAGAATAFLDPPFLGAGAGFAAGLLAGFFVVDFFVAIIY